MSPAVILANSLQLAKRRGDSDAVGGGRRSGEREQAACSPPQDAHLGFYEHDSFSLSGEAIAHRIGARPDPTWSRIRRVRDGPEDAASSPPRMAPGEAP